MNKKTTLVEQRRILRRNIIFNCIKKNNGILSRNDIVRSTHYSTTTVSAIVDEMVADGIVREEDISDGRVGRRPVLLSINDDSMYFAGLECAAAMIAITVLDCMDSVVYQNALKLDEPTAVSILSAMESILNLLKQHKPDIWEKLINITVGLPGKPDVQHGIGISYIIVKDWHNIDVKSYLSERFNKDFHFTHNIDSMLLGYQANAGRDEDHSILLIVLRRGVGARLYSKGVLLSDYGIACELGHLKARNANRLCNCGKRGCYDTEVSIPALRAKITEALHANKMASLQALYNGDLSKITMQDFYNAIGEGDPDALEMLEETAVYIGELIAEAEMILTPDNVVLYSDLCQLGYPFTSVIEKTVPTQLPQSEQKEVPIEYHILDTYLCSFGAAIVGIRSYFDETSDVI